MKIFIATLVPQQLAEGWTPLKLFAPEFVIDGQPTNKVKYVVHYSGAWFDSHHQYLIRVSFIIGDYINFKVPLYVSIFVNQDPINGTIAQSKLISDLLEITNCFLLYAFKYNLIELLSSNRM